MRGNSFIPRDYDVFTGLDVSKKSMSVTFTNHQGFIRSLNMPHKRGALLNYVRKHFRIRRLPLSMRLDLPGMGCMMGWRPRLIPV